MSLPMAVNLPMEMSLPVAVNLPVEMSLPVARELAPAGLRSGPLHFFSNTVLAGLRLLRSRARASSLATGICV